MKTIVSQLKIELEEAMLLYDELSNEYSRTTNSSTWYKMNETLVLIRDIRKKIPTA